MLLSGSNCGTFQTKLTQKFMCFVNFVSLFAKQKNSKFSLLLPAVTAYVMFINETHCSIFGVHSRFYNQLGRYQKFYCNQLMFVNVCKDLQIERVQNELYLYHKKF